MKLAKWLGLTGVCVAVVACGAAGAEIKLAVTPSADGADVPVSAEISLPAELANVSGDEIAVTMKSPSGQAVAGQIRIVPQMRRLSPAVRWVLPAAKAGVKQVWTAELTKGKPADGFSWKDEKGKHLDLVLGGKPVTRYMYERDTSDDKRAHETYKVYTHVMTADGTDTITKGPGGKYTHHRGIFLGFNRLGYDEGKKNDWWHMKGVTQEHREFQYLSAGPAQASNAAVIHWNDGAGKPVVIERRGQRVFRQSAPAMLLFEFSSQLTAARSDVVLGGDPEHAGFQYRPHNDVNVKATKYLFPDEKITAANVKNEVDLPWAAECYELKGRKYTVQHMNHPENPKGAKYSAYRDYGRFGAFATVPIEKGRTASLRYRIWVAEGEQLDRATMQARWESFANPPTVEAVK